MEDVLAVILGGGRGTRLSPLTQYRSKPAVPIGGKYRLIDIPVSNCLNSQLRSIFVLTQYNSESLHKHLSLTYKFDIFSSAFVSLLAAEQTEENADWFQGTADAVRRSLRHLRSHRWNEVVILSGDHLYQMDYRKMIEAHRRSRADATVAVTPVSADQTSGFGILKVNSLGRIVHFEEKPGADRLAGLASPVPGADDAYLASMGIYVFSRETLEASLQDESLVDFGRHVIPDAVPKMRVQSYIYKGYWEDVGTIRTYYDANLALCQSVPPFDFYDSARPVYTHPRFLPATKVESCKVEKSLVCEGSILVGAEVERSLIGIRARIGTGAKLRDSLLLGANRYETLDEMKAAEGRGEPAIGIGEECEIQGAIIDMNARIGRGVKILNRAGKSESDGPGYQIREGVVVVCKDAVIPDGTVI